MHKMPSTSSVARLWFASVLILLLFPLVPMTAGALTWAVLVSDTQWMKLSMASLGLVLVMFLALACLVPTASCPLCRVPVLAKKGRGRHRSARPLLGSHRARVANDVIFHSSFRCPYCGESTSLEVRRRGSGYR